MKPLPTLVFLFVCLFVGIKPEKLYSAPCWEESKPPESGHTRAEAHTTTCIPKDSGTTVWAHVPLNPWSTPCKLTGWLASLDLRKPNTRLILNHRTAFPYAWCGMLGERSTIWWVEIVSCLPTKQHMDTYMRTYTKVTDKIKQSKRKDIAQQN